MRRQKTAGPVFESRCPAMTAGPAHPAPPSRGTNPARCGCTGGRSRRCGSRRAAPAQSPRRWPGCATEPAGRLLRSRTRQSAGRSAPLVRRVRSSTMPACPVGHALADAPAQDTSNELMTNARAMRARVLKPERAASSTWHRRAGRPSPAADASHWQRAFAATRGHRPGAMPPRPVSTEPTGMVAEPAASVAHVEVDGRLAPVEDEDGVDGARIDLHCLLGGFDTGRLRLCLQRPLLRSHLCVVRRRGEGHVARQWLSRWSSLCRRPARPMRPARRASAPSRAGATEVVVEHPQVDVGVATDSGDRVGLAGRDDDIRTQDRRALLARAGRPHRDRVGAGRQPLVVRQRAIADAREHRGELRVHGTTSPTRRPSECRATGARAAHSPASRPPTPGCPMSGRSDSVATRQRAGQARRRRTVTGTPGRRSGSFHC